MSKVIVSLTSFPERIQSVYKVLDSIANQTKNPDKTILYLSKEQFPDYKIPNFNTYDKIGFEVCWCDDDLKSHKKYYYAMQEYPEDIVITIDDDVKYKDTAIEELFDMHYKFPQAVIARRTHLVTCTEDGDIAPYDQWYSECTKFYGIPRMDLVATGCAGVLYPPHCLDEEVFNQEVFMGQCKYADDLWLKVMELCKGTPIVLACKSFDDKELEECNDTALCLNQNANGNNDVQLNNIINIYNEYPPKGTLKDRLFLHEKLFIKDVSHVRSEDMKSRINKWILTIEQEPKVLVYGAGKIANCLYDVLKQYGYREKVKAFIVNDERDNVEQIEGIAVKDYRKYITNTEKIVIGVGYAKQEAIVSQLVGEGIIQDRIILMNHSIEQAVKEIGKYK